MRFRLTFIFIAFGAANGPTFVQSFTVSDSFTQSRLSTSGTESLQKRMLQKSVDVLREENLLERTASRSFPNTGSTPDKQVQHGDLEKSFYPPTSAMGRPETHIAPLVFNGRLSAETFATRRLEQNFQIPLETANAQAQAVILDTFEKRGEEDTKKLEHKFRTILETATADNNAEARAVILRNLKRLEAERATPTDFAHQPKRPAWVVFKYERSWETAGLDPESMIAISKALGISEHGVQPITSETYENLQNTHIYLKTPDDAVRPSLIWFGAHPHAQAIWSWFKNENFITLSSKDQDILEFNIEQSQQKPWWTLTQLRLWQSQNMPWKQMAQVGSLLKIGDDEPIADKDVIRVRKSIVNILDQLSVTHNIERQPYRGPSIAFGDIAERLRQATPLPHSKQTKRFRNEYDLKFSAISGSSREIDDIRNEILYGNLHHIQPSSVRDLLRLHLLMRGVPTLKAPDFAEALKFVRATSIKILIGRGEEASAHLKNFFPKPKEDYLYRVSTYPRLKMVFKNFLGEDILESCVHKAELAIFMRRTKTAFSALRNRVKKVVPILSTKASNRAP